MKNFFIASLLISISLIPETSFAQTYTDGELYAGCMEMTQNFNKEAPRILDKYTTLLNLSCQPKEYRSFTYLSQIKTKLIPYFDAEKFKAIMTKIQINRMCSDSEMKSAILGNWKTNFDFVDEEGKQVFQFAVTQKDCE